MQTPTLQNLTQFQTLQALVNRRLPNGKEIDQKTAMKSLARFLPIILEHNEANKKTLLTFGTIKPEDKFLQEWQMETKEIDQLIHKAEKMFVTDLLSRHLGL